jgi:hypothetical protein
MCACAERYSISKLCHFDLAFLILNEYMKTYKWNNIPYREIWVRYEECVYYRDKDYH